MILQHGAAPLPRHVVHDTQAELFPAIRAMLGIPDHDAPGATKPPVPAPGTENAAAAVPDRCERDPATADGASGASSGANVGPDAGAADGSALDTMRYRTIESNFLNLRCEMLLHELACEYSKRPPTDIVYPGAPD